MSSGEFLITFDRLCDQRLDLDGLQGEYDFVGGNSFHVKNAVDEPDQPLAVGMRDGQQAHRLTGQSFGGVTHQQGERAGNRRKRGA